MLDTMKRLMLVLLGLLILGGMGYLLAAWVAPKYPRFQSAFLRLGDAVVSMAIGLTGLYVVVIVLRALGWIPASGG